MSQEKNASSIYERPVMTCSWNDKIKDNMAWFKRCICFGVSKNFFFSQSRSNWNNEFPLMYDFYNIYNNQFPEYWFKPILDPLSADDPQNKKFPAMIRPVTIIRPNVDLLINEWLQRPIVFDVENLSPESTNLYTDKLREKLVESVTNIFKKQMQKNIDPTSNLQKDPNEQEMQLPEKVLEDFQLNYKDIIAKQGYLVLKRMILENDIILKWYKMFKDYVIAGSCRSYKNIENNTLVYERVSPIFIRDFKALDDTYIEDSEFISTPYFMTTSKIVDKFYTELSEDQIIQLEKYNNYTFPSRISLYPYNSGSSALTQETYGTIPIYHVCWKGRKKVLMIEGTNKNGEVSVDQYDEDYKIGPNEKLLEEYWVDEVYEGWCVWSIGQFLGQTTGQNVGQSNDIGSWEVNDNMFFGMRPLPCQRNAMNNFSYCKMPYNGVNFSDTHSPNLSVVQLGIPYQILYVIITYKLELLLAKNKGKGFIMDIGAIPKIDGWTTEKWLHYIEAMGMIFIDRSSPTIDKTFNQYQMVDMSTMDKIRELMEYQTYIKSQWDEVLGITRQRKGETYASDGKGVNEQAIFQSSVISDNLFYTFEEFIKKELQGLLDLSKFLYIEGKSGLYNDDLLKNEMIDIDPNEYAVSELGIMVNNTREVKQKREERKQIGIAMLQNKAKPSTVLDFLNTDSYAKLKSIMLRVEEIDVENAQANQKAEQQAQQQADARAKEMEKLKFEFEKQLAMIKGDYQVRTEQIRGEYQVYARSQRTADEIAKDEIEVQKLDVKREEIASKTMMESQKASNDILKHHNEVNLKQQELGLQDKELDIKRQENLLDKEL